MSRAKTSDDAAARTRLWVGTWADVEQAQLETMLMATPAQRLAWLEEALRLAQASGALVDERSVRPSPLSVRPKTTSRLGAANDECDS